MTTPAEPTVDLAFHDVLVLTRTLLGSHGPAEVIDSVFVDGLDLHIPDDGDVVIESLANRHGLQTVTVSILAGRIRYQHEESTDA